MGALSSICQSLVWRSSFPVRLQIGMPLAVGACIGRIVRLLPDGFAVKFVDFLLYFSVDGWVS
jgi:hypothetical protein